MSDHMPELIWAEEPDIFDSFGFWHARQKDVLTEYVRADIPAAQSAALAERDATIANLTAANMVLVERVEEARVVIEWYANPEIYARSVHGIAFDNGDLSYHARAWLAGKAGAR